MLITLFAWLIIFFSEKTKSKSEIYLLVMPNNQILKNAHSLILINQNIMRYL